MIMLLNFMNLPKILIAISTLWNWFKVMIYLTMLMKIIP